MDFKQLQEEQREWLLHNFPRQVNGVTPLDVSKLIGCGGELTSSLTEKINSGELAGVQSYALLGVMEEIGELSHAYIKFIRKIREVDKADMEDAVGDIVVFLASFCNTVGIDMDLQECVERCWAEVRGRDWVKYPTDGRHR